MLSSVFNILCVGNTSCSVTESKPRASKSILSIQIAKLRHTSSRFDDSSFTETTVYDADYAYTQYSL